MIFAEYTYLDKGIPQLRVANSFSKEKEVFVPKHGDQNLVTWYMCGPTVYDHSHIGHARTYIGFDIIKRIMRDFFGYNIKLCMNITDIDDKIIREANAQRVSYSDFSRKYENEFFEDMKNLNVELPEVITRVSEFVPEIIQFIEKIIQNGYAYESNGSVYFNVERYDDGEKHKYAKLEPTSAKELEKLKEGEGVLANVETQEKKNTFDFALWKKSKEGEPKWDSPWGEGRPGWHIECSAMAAEIFKEWPIDIHSGGVDLRFPHHDNEIAQSEAYYECDQWIKYFLHTGALNIEGKKMSKSLKNFITTKHILTQYNARQIRIMFLLHNWNTLMNYHTDKSFQEAVEKERHFSEFFKSLKAILRQCDVKTTNQKWNAKDFELNNLLTKVQTDIYDRMADNFDTPAVIHKLSELVTATNAYLQQDKTLIKVPLVKSVSRYVFKILKVFGVYDEDVVPAVVEAGQLNQEDIITPFMEVLTKFRDQIKEKAGEDKKMLFNLCDELRDDILPNLGIRLEDRGKQEAIWKYEDKEVLLKERQAKIVEKEKKEEEKRKKKEEDYKKKSTSGSEFFKVFKVAEYSKFDEAGLPTHDAKGKELSESIRNKLKKDQNKQNEIYQKFMKEEESKKEETQ